MKLLLENFKKNMEERFRGPTDDPSFSDPGADEPAGFEQASEKADDMLDMAESGKLVPLKDNLVIRFEDFGDDDGQYLIGTKEQVMDMNSTDVQVFRKDQRDDLEEMLTDLVLQDMKDEGPLEESLKTLIKNKILENIKK